MYFKIQKGLYKKIYILKELAQRDCSQNNKILVPRWTFMDP